jgi:hypothetical protein
MASALPGEFRQHRSTKHRGAYLAAIGVLSHACRDSAARRARAAASWLASA